MRIAVLDLRAEAQKLEKLQEKRLRKPCPAKL